jgi:hypothetical protein
MLLQNIQKYTFPEGAIPTEPAAVDLFKIRPISDIAKDENTLLQGNPTFFSSHPDKGVLFASALI